MDGSVTSIEDKHITQRRQELVDWDDILLICDDVGESWRDLGTELKLPKGVLRNIGPECNSNRNRAWQVVDRWGQKVGNGATVGLLTDALEKIGKKSAAQKLVGEPVEAGLSYVRAGSAKLRTEICQLRKDLENFQEKHQTVLTELKEGVQKLLTEKNKDEQQNMGTGVQGLATTIKQLETYISTEKREREVLVQYKTRLGKACDQLEKCLRVVQENVKSKDQKDLVGRSSESDSNVSDKTTQKSLGTRQGEIGVADRTHQDIALTGDQTCSRCPALEKELNDIKSERETIRNKLSQLEIKHKEDKTWGEEKNEMDKKINENEPEKSKVKNTNKIKKKKKEKLTKKKTNIKKEKNETVETVENDESITEMIERLMVEREEIALSVQAGSKELGQLKTEKDQLEARIEQLKKELNKKELECKRLQEDLKIYKAPESQVVVPTGNEFTTRCHGVICILNRNASSELLASRSSDGKGIASAIFDHKKGTTSGTQEKKDSWWSIDLGLSNRLVITNYALRHGRNDGQSVLTRWRLEGSNDGTNWENLEPNVNDKIERDRDFVSYSTGTWPVQGKIEAFRYFRIYQTGKHSSHKHGIYLSGIELFGVLLTSKT